MTNEEKVKSLTSSKTLVKKVLEENKDPKEFTANQKLTLIKAKEVINELVSKMF